MVWPRSLGLDSLKLIHIQQKQETVHLHLKKQEEPQCIPPSLPQVLLKTCSEPVLNLVWTESKSSLSWVLSEPRYSSAFLFFTEKFKYINQSLVQMSLRQVSVVFQILNSLLLYIICFWCFLLYIYKQFDRLFFFRVDLFLILFSYICETQHRLGFILIWRRPT